MPCSTIWNTARAELHIHIDGVTPGANVLLVDDLLATGGTMQAGCKLVEKAGGQVVACAFLVELAFLNGRDKLKPARGLQLDHVIDGR